MAKNEKEIVTISSIRRKRHKILCNFEIPDPKIETESGQSQSVLKLYQDFVLGRLDPSQIGGHPQYDSPGSDEVDPFNSFGMTLEQADALRQDAEREVKRAKKQPKKDVANANPDEMQPEASDQERKPEDDKRA